MWMSNGALIATMNTFIPCLLAACLLLFYQSIHQFSPYNITYTLADWDFFLQILATISIFSFNTDKLCKHLRTNIESNLYPPSRRICTWDKRDSTHQLMFMRIFYKYTSGPLNHYERL